MYANIFRRIALAQGLLDGKSRPTRAPAPQPAPAATQTEDAPEPCEPRREDD